MSTKITLFSQVIGKLPKEIIRKIIRTAGTDKHCKGYDTWSQFVSMVFCQFSQCDSVRDISNGLRSATGNLNHLGISRAPSKSTVAYQNANRDSGVFRNIYYALYAHFGQQGLILCWLKHVAKYKWALANLVVSLRLNTFTKIDFQLWLDAPFSPPPDEEI